MATADSYSDVLASEFFDSDFIVLDQYGLLFLNCFGLIVAFLGFLECARATDLNWHRQNARQLKSTHSNQPDILHIQTNDYPSALILPKLYANAPTAMRFTDATSEITIYPATQEVYAYFDTGDNCTFGIPPDYQTYSIHFDGTASITATDIDCILQWREATTIIMLDTVDLAHQLQQRPNELKRMRRLAHLELSVQRESFANVDIGQFLLNLPALEYLTFAATHLSDSEFEEFVGKQPQVDGWRQSIGERRLYYETEQMDLDQMHAVSKCPLQKIQQIWMKLRRRLRRPFPATGFYAVSDETPA